MLDRSTAPKVKPFGRLSLPSEQVVVLSNGLTLHVLNGGAQDVARLTIITEGGSADCQNPCVATFAAELLREGNSNADSEAIADKIDYNGAWLNCGASGHFTTVQLSSLSAKLSSLLPVVVSCVTDPVFPQHAFEIIKQKGIARQQLNLSKVSFLATADNKRLICGSDHPESHILTSDEIAAITRQDLIDFHAGCLDAKLMHAYLCGKLADGLVETVSRHLETIPSRGLGSPIRINKYEAEAPTCSIVKKAGSLQSAVVMSLPAIPREHPDYNALRMTVTALGGYFGSRLMMNIREDKGYTYGISSALIGSREGGYIMISAQCDNRYTDALVDEVKAELRRMVDCPLSADELDRLRFNVASDLASTLDSPFTMMDYYEMVRTVGIPYDYFDARQKTLASIDAEKVCDLSRRYLDPDQLRISIAGSLTADE